MLCVQFLHDKFTIIACFIFDIVLVGVYFIFDVLPVDGCSCRHQRPARLPS
jgi:hypothetical protein